MREFFYSKKMRIKSREFARQCYVRANGDVELAEKYAKEGYRELGNPLLILTIGVLILEAIFYAIKIWKELNLSLPPRIPVGGEGFGLADGEPWALNPAELKQMNEGKL